MSEQSSTAQTFKTTCCYCGVGCGVKASVENNEVIAVAGDADHPANYGRLCVKGSSLHETQANKDRLLKPQINGKEVTWEQAISESATKFKNIVEEFGPDSVAFYLSGQLLTEDYYVANKLIKGFIGTANVDTNSRLCMASAVVAHKRAFGSDCVPGCYEDLEVSDLIILVGSNTAYAHPIVYQRIVKAKEDRPELKVVVLDPRATATCEIADYHLPLKPGSDAFFFNGLLAHIDKNKATDIDFIKNHCDGYEEALAQAVSSSKDIATTAELCDLDVSLVETVFDLFIANEKVVTVFSQGINQSSSGVDKGNAIINCHLASGKIGKPGAAPFSITGQPNAMGGREVGGLANQLAAHMGYQSTDDIDRVERFWSAPNMARKEGLKAVDMFKAVHEGKIKAIWIMATNPVVSMPDANFVKEALKRCELVIVNECVVDTDTAKLAHVLLPATTWSEKHGTVTNSERCISLQKGFLPAPGQALHDWQIICKFAQAMGFEKEFSYRHPVEIFREHATLSAFENTQSRGFNIEAMSEIELEDYENLKPIQWPVTKSKPEGSARLFDDGQFFTANNRAQFIAISPRYPALKPEVDQVIMNTGRIRDQWHTMSRTGVAAKLLGHSDEPYVEVHPKDAEHFGLVDGGLAVLENRGAQFTGRVRFHSGQRRGEVFVPMHWNDKYASSARADALVNDIRDPICGQPEFKHSPVKIRAFKLQSTGTLNCQKDFRPELGYWAKITLDGGFKYRFAHDSQNIDWALWLKANFNECDEWLELSDSENLIYRAAGFKSGKLIVSLNVSSGQSIVKESAWLDRQLGKDVPVDQQYSILAGSPGGEVEDEGAIICSCFQVGEKTIEKAIFAGCDSTQSLGKRLKCGTNCGSCIPELKGLIHKSKSQAKELIATAS